MKRIAFPYQQFLPSKVLINLILFIKLILLVPSAYALEHIEVTGTENGLRLGENFEIWHDPTGKTSLVDARLALADQNFGKLKSKGSTGLKPGSFWSHFYIKNTSNQAIELDIEYVDHQLISLQAYQGVANSPAEFSKISDLALYNAFSERQIAHHRFVFPTIIPANATAEYFVKYNSDKAGYIFPDLRIWHPDNLRVAQSLETGLTAFLLGGLFLMSLFTLVSGITAKGWVFYSYSIYAFAKLVAWCTILGYTHQFILRDNFHWSYMSLGGAFAIFSGLFFARVFLQTRRFTKKLDYILLFMMANAAVLFVSALFKITAVSILSITLALLLYPLVPIIGIIRWRQGSIEALIFSLAWLFLATGLVLQALRDLGYIEHNFINYYWPPVFSFMEILVAMIAIGFRINSFRNEKEKAEKEAHTDELTGINNRRSFFLNAEELFAKFKNRSHPFSVLMFDIDHFKLINDEYGHAAGDKVLQVFSEFIMSKIRDEDIFGRLGGEEFALIVSNSEKDAVAQMADRLRNDISELEVKHCHNTIKITVSIGVAHLDNEQHLDELVSRADKALYHAKSMGRNRLELAL